MLPGQALRGYSEYNEALASETKRIEAELGDSGRVLIRASGTEPLLRVMVEGQDAAEVGRLAQRLAQVVESAMAA